MTRALGAATIFTMADDVLSTGIPGLDRLLSEPPRLGEILHAPGPETTVKTSLLFHLMEHPGTAVVMDLEMRPEHDLEAYGVPPDDDPIMPEPGS